MKRSENVLSRHQPVCLTSTNADALLCATRVTVRWHSGPFLFPSQLSQMTEVFDLESLVDVEQTYVLSIWLQKKIQKVKHLTTITSFYDSGYHDGFAHGRIHGSIEGKALGREKGFEMWEEIGFYEGFALTWRAVLRQQQSKEDELGWLSQSDLLSDLFVAVEPPSTSDIYLNISPDFPALTHPAQTTTLLPHLIYRNFYVRFDLDTKHSAQYLAPIPDLGLLTKHPTTKNGEIQICK